jgi:pimeloyl-ACP methyl ester carboxylesterase
VRAADAQGAASEMAPSAFLGRDQRNREVQPEVWGCFMTTNAASGQLPDLRGLGRQAIASVTAPVAKLRWITVELATVFDRLVRRSNGYRHACSPSQRNGAKLAATMSSLEASSDDPLASRSRSLALAFLNGVVGHDLAATGDPLALTMQLRRNGRALKLERRALAQAFPDATGKLVVLVHGLCMSDLQWSSQNHDHGAALASDLGYTPVYVSYNSGLHISTNGKALAGALEALVSEWPVVIKDFAIIGYSMGGLVARSACRSGEEAGHVWRKKLRKLVFLGTPHHGAPLERMGNWVEATLGEASYTSGLARLWRFRSAGITDLRYGNLLDEDWQGKDRFARGPDGRAAVLLPDDVACYAMAATVSRSPGALAGRLVGDGFVPLDSALGGHESPSRNLNFPADRQRIMWETRHFDLVKRQVYDQILCWISETPDATLAPSAAPSAIGLGATRSARD